MFGYFSSDLAVQTDRTMASAWLLLFLSVSSATTLVNGLSVSVYYESLCPDSIRFVTKQLYPTYQQLSEYFLVDFVPYGKAYHETDPWSISCQHGASECLGNAVQACMLSRLANNTEQVRFVNCVMSDSSPHLAGAKCAQMLGLSYDGVAECSTNEEGQGLLAALGDRTHSFSPAITFVPTIAVNDSYDSNTQSTALSNFKSVICSRIEEPKPSACNTRKKYY